MKKSLILSFDLIRPGELNNSLAISSMLSYLKKSNEYGNTFTCHHECINVFEQAIKKVDNNIQLFLNKTPLDSYETIAISAYIWNEHILNPLITEIRNRGFRGKIVLGGYQITYSRKNQLIIDYPQCDIFISGYAEVGLLEAILIDKPQSPIHINKVVSFQDLPSPYLTGDLIIPKNHHMIRLETKRGCPYRCNFCAHRDLTKNRMHKFELERTFKELALIKQKEIHRVNVLDPVFNVGREHLDVMREMDRLNFSQTTFTFQTRPELIKNKTGEAFLDLVEKTNSYLEFGVQTVIEKEFKKINRPNNIAHLTSLFNHLNERNIGFEVSLIYGLPLQTLDSFKKSVDFLMKNGCSKIFAFPLMLLKGTELYSQKDDFNMNESTTGAYNIPLVTSSNSYTESEWLKMKEIADNLGPIMKRVA